MVPVLTYGLAAIIATELFACRLTLSLRDVKKNESTNTFIGSEKKQRHFVKVLVFGYVHPANVNAPEIETWYSNASQGPQTKLDTFKQRDSAWQAGQA